MHIHREDERKVCRLNKVFIAAGHGGKDSGGTANGLEEKNLALSISLYCKAELLRHEVEVMLSRTQDVDNPVTEQVKQCNAFAPMLAVNVHINMGGGDGFEIYHTRLGGKGKQLAQNIEDEVLKIGQNSRGLKTRLNDAGKDYFAFIRETVCPAVIAEAGFLDTDDHLIFSTPNGQRRFGIAYAKGILRSLGIQWRPDNNSAIQAATDIIRTKAGLEQSTIDYLLQYTYARELVSKLAAAME